MMRTAARKKAGRPAASELLLVAARVPEQRERGEDLVRRPPAQLLPSSGPHTDRLAHTLLLPHHCERTHTHTHTHIVSLLKYNM